MSRLRDNHIVGTSSQESIGKLWDAIPKKSDTMSPTQKLLVCMKKLLRRCHGVKQARKAGISLLEAYLLWMSVLTCRPELLADLKVVVDVSKKHFLRIGEVQGPRTKSMLLQLM